METDNLHLYKENHRQLVFNNALRLPVCVCQLHHKMILLARNYLPEGITSDTRWVTLERIETLRNGMVRATFDMTTLDTLFKNRYRNALV